MTTTCQLDEIDEPKIIPSCKIAFRKNECADFSLSCEMAWLIFTHISKTLPTAMKDT